jgi:hypothetical protein
MSEEFLARGPRERRTITFMGNTYDLAALVALITGAVLLFLCLTCGQGMYCLPLAPIVAGFVGLASAARAADPKRTRLYSWLGLGSGCLSVLFVVMGIGLYVGLLVLVAESWTY